ncbi:TPA: toxin co-regulated pilus biosynthesis Q family protein [Vibrio vulnificus]|nr:toxin co-regulated pilus biosynthesis Q family protein [Vibrio vulnificus]
MRQLSYALSALVLLSGCASQEYTGQGEYFELYNINVIERDLSVFKPTQIVSTTSTSASKYDIEDKWDAPPPIKTVTVPTTNSVANITKVTPTSQERKTKPLAIIPEYKVRHGERYQAALTRWVRAAGYPNVAWQMSQKHLAKMDGLSDKPIIFKGSLKQAVSELSAHLEVPLQVVMDKSMKVAGVYDFDGEARITHVTGTSIKAVTEKVVQNYGLRWDNSDNLSRSWLSPNDYKFGADYYLLTAKDDIETALTIVLDDFPVYSSIVESTGQVIIQEER